MPCCQILVGADIETIGACSVSMVIFAFCKEFHKQRLRPYCLKNRCGMGLRCDQYVSRGNRERVSNGNSKRMLSYDFIRCYRTKILVMASSSR